MTQVMELIPLYADSHNKPALRHVADLVEIGELLKTSSGIHDTSRILFKVKKRIPLITMGSEMEICRETLIHDMTRHLKLAEKLTWMNKYVKDENTMELSHFLIKLVGYEDVDSRNFSRGIKILLDRGVHHRPYIKVRKDNCSDWPVIIVDVADIMCLSVKRQLATSLVILLARDLQYRDIITSLGEAGKKLLAEKYISFPDELNKYRLIVKLRQKYIKKFFKLIKTSAKLPEVLGILGIVQKYAYLKSGNGPINAVRNLPITHIIDLMEQIPPDVREVYPDKVFSRDDFNAAIEILRNRGD